MSLENGLKFKVLRFRKRMNDFKDLLSSFHVTGTRHSVRVTKKDKMY